MKRQSLLFLHARREIQKKYFFSHVRREIIKSLFLHVRKKETIKKKVFSFYMYRILFLEEKKIAQLLNYISH